MTGCMIEQIGLVLLSLALLISLCLNVIFCMRRKAIFCKDTDECCYPHIHDGERSSQNEGHHVHDLNHREQQENPIYGNISTDRTGPEEGWYEMMTMPHTRDCMTSLEPDLNYASLDLKVANKYKKKQRHQQGHTPGRNKLHDQLPVHLTPPLNAVLDVEAEMDVHLPSRDTSIMVSHSSIYLNSQQIAQETEEMERERGMNMEREIVGWEGIRKREDGGSREWKGAQESEGGKDRQDYSNGSVCTQPSQVESIQSGTDHIISSFSHDSVLQD